MKNSTILCLVFMSMLSACQRQPHDHTLIISVTNWIGYTPLFYAKEKGSLDLLDIKLINVVSLSENIHLYKAGNSDVFGGTQYELSLLRTDIPELVPIIIFDRSKGGDKVMSNLSIPELQSSTGQIDTYLEMGSINIVILENFIRKFNIDESRINYIDISSLNTTQDSKPLIAVTYIPYDTKLKENGFKELVSTKNGLELLVLGAIFTHKDELVAHKTQFQALKGLVDEALLALKDNPKEYYETIKPYFEGMTYQEFLTQLNDIEWINNNLEQSLKVSLEESSFSIKELL